MKNQTRQITEAVSQNSDGTFNQKYQVVDGSKFGTVGNISQTETGYEGYAFGCKVQWVEGNAWVTVAE